MTSLKEALEKAGLVKRGQAKRKEEAEKRKLEEAKKNPDLDPEGDFFDIEQELLKGDPK